MLRHQTPCQDQVRFHTHLWENQLLSENQNHCSSCEWAEWIRTSRIPIWWWYSIFQSRLPTSHHYVRNVRPRHAWSNSCSSWSRRVPSWYPRWVKPGLCPRFLEPKNCKIETHWNSYLSRIVLRIHPIYTMTRSPWEKEQLRCFPWLLEVGRSASMPRNSAPVPEPLVGVDPWIWSSSWWPPKQPDV